MVDVIPGILDLFILDKSMTPFTVKQNKKLNEVEIESKTEK